MKNTRQIMAVMMNNPDGEYTTKEIEENTNLILSQVQEAIKFLMGVRIIKKPRYEKYKDNYGMPHRRAYYKLNPSKINIVIRLLREEGIGEEA